MSLKRIKKNLGFLIAGVVLFGVGVNVYMELRSGATSYECQYISTP